MREILFRGFHPCEDGDKTVCVKGKAVKGLWVYGAYCYMGDKQQPIPHIISYSKDDKFGDWLEVLPSTVGQYTSVNDDYNFRIFTGDIVVVNDHIVGSSYNDFVGAVVFNECGYFIEPTGDKDSLSLYNECAFYKIIGNTHEEGRDE